MPASGSRSGVVASAAIVRATGPRGYASAAWPAPARRSRWRRLPRRRPVPGVAAVLADRAARGDDVVYVTNNSMHYRADYLTRLAAMGAPVRPTGRLVRARDRALPARPRPDVRRVLAVGASGLERELREAGLDVVTAGHAATRMSQEGIDGWEAAGHPDAVVVGLDPQLTYLRLAAAADCVRAGARFIATNRDPIYPTERGFRPGAGSIVAAIEAATGVDAGVDRQARAVPARGRGARRRSRAGRGDHDRRRPRHDLAAARAVGARSVLMLTGVTTAGRGRGAPRRPAADRDRGRCGRAGGRPGATRRRLTPEPVSR